ncbi:hypothetical protein TNCV_3812831 [Trichonephila clavipes]|nr:hypothetical protein TNCV_3812831 [Trichonephila clavipes]
MKTMQHERRHESSRVHCKESQSSNRQDRVKKHYQGYSEWDNFGSHLFTIKSLLEHIAVTLILAVANSLFYTVANKFCHNMKYHSSKNPKLGQAKIWFRDG